jgi:immunity protein, SdpI family
MNRRPFLIVGVAVVAFMTLVSIWAWLQLPAGTQVAIHYGPSGVANRYVDKTIGLFIVPVIAAGIVVVRFVIPVIEPRRDNLARSGPAYTAVAIALIGLLGAVHVAGVAADLGSTVNMAAFVLLALGVLFLVIGNYLSKVRSNFLFGIRTPWTLTSERSWTRTHRLGGRLFALFGVVLIVAVFVLPDAWLPALVLVGSAVVVVAPLAYSYVVWRGDPERRAIG